MTLWLRLGWVEGWAEGKLYFDDGILVEQSQTEEVRMMYKGWRLSR